MYKDFFCKENAFNSVIFGSIFLMALFKSIFCKEQLPEISVVLSLLILLLSIFTLIIKVFESVNDKQTKLLLDIQNDVGYDKLTKIFGEEIIYWEKIQDYTESDLKSKLELDNSNNNNSELIINYNSIAHTRKIIRQARKVFLFIYYFLFMLILTYLFISNDLSPYINKFSISDLAIWSFVIILFEILLKNPLSRLICKIIYKHKNIRYDEI